jgi:hypothetical protein
MAEKTKLSAELPEKTLVKFKVQRDTYIGQIINSQVVPAKHPGRESGSRIYLVKIKQINDQEIKEPLVTTIGEKEIFAYQLPKQPIPSK